LVRHALAAGLDEPALRFSMAAGDDAARLLAARDAAVHYGRAIELAERQARGGLIPELHARRGHAFVSITMWPEARRELETALAGLGPGERVRTAEILVDLAEACFWLLDVSAVGRHATEALDLAHQLGRSDLETEAVAWLGAAEASAGSLPASVEQYQRAIGRARAVGIAPPAIAESQGAVALYWLGRLDEAVAWSRQAVTTAREANDIPWTILSLPHLGLALAGSGRYADAMRVFEEARRLGREYGVENLLARALAMSAGFRLDLFDYAGAEALAQEARDLALSVEFPPPAVSAGIDLLLNYARRHEVDRAAKLLDDVTAVAEQTAGFHGWLWRLRLAEARAELALARGEWQEALRRADEAIGQSRLRGRVKYRVIGLTTRAQALIALGRTTEAIADLGTAVALARPVGDPALFLRAAAALVAIDGDDALAAEGRAAVKRIAGALPDADMRRRFEAAEPLRVLSERTRMGIETKE
jgi:tetratricopeptide (TPR) repeat protein